MGSENNPILLYDGVCGLCNRLVRFALRHDRRDFFRFASLQSVLAAGILSRHGIAAGVLDTFYVVVDPQRPGESLLARSDAARFVLTSLGGRWKVLGLIFGYLPRGFRDALYNVVARNRYQIFGKFDSCPVPDPRDRHKFLDL